MAYGEEFVDRATRSSDKEGPDAAAAVTSGGSSMASPGADSRARASGKRVAEVAEAAAAVASGGSSGEKPTATRARGADPRAHSSGKRQEEVDASGGDFHQETVASFGAEPRASGKRMRYEMVPTAAAEGTRRTATLEDSRPSGKRLRHDKVPTAPAEGTRRTATLEDSRASGKRRLHEEEKPSSQPSSEVVRAHDVLSLPENLSAYIMRSLPRQMAIWQLNHQPASFRFQLKDGLYPSPDDLTRLLSSPELRRIRRFMLEVQTDNVTNLDMAGYLTRASQCSNEELCLEYHESVDNIFIFHLARCGTSLQKLVLRNITMAHEYLAVTPVFSALSVLHLCSVRISDASLTRVVALCPSINTLSLHNIRYLGEVVFEPPASVLRSLTIKMCGNITLLDLEELRSLERFFYIGPLANMRFSVQACLQDMLLCTGDTEYPGDPIFEWLQSVPDFSMLTVLTFSSGCLPVLTSDTVRDLHLHTLRELQVIFVSLDCTVRGQLIAFLHYARCSSLERLFLQLGPTNDALEICQVDLQDDLEFDLTSLYLIRAEPFEGNNVEMSLLSTLLLMKAPSLRNLVLCSTGDQGALQSKVDILNECSKTAEVLLMQDGGSWPHPRHLMPSDFPSIAGAE